MARRRSARINWVGDCTSFVTEKGNCVNFYREEIPGDGYWCAIDGTESASWSDKFEAYKEELGLGMFDTFPHAGAVDMAVAGFASRYNMKVSSRVAAEYEEGDFREWAEGEFDGAGTYVITDIPNSQEKEVSVETASELADAALEVIDMYGKIEKKSRRVAMRKRAGAQNIIDEVYRRVEADAPYSSEEELVDAIGYAIDDVFIPSANVFEAAMDYISDSDVLPLFIDEFYNDAYMYVMQDEASLVDKWHTYTFYVGNDDDRFKEVLDTEDFEDEDDAMSWFESLVTEYFGEDGTFNGYDRYVLYDETADEEVDGN